MPKSRNILRNFQVVFCYLAFALSGLLGVEHTRCVRPGVVAITFDDGPYMYTPELLDLLKEKNVTTTFFINGQNYMSINDKAAQDIIRRAVSEGHTIGHHTWSHPDLTTLNPQGITNQMNHLTDELKRLGLLENQPRYMRPPYGSTNQQVIKILNERNYEIVKWSIDPMDWSHPGDTAAGMEDYTRKLSGTDASKTRGFISLHHDVQFGCVRLAIAAIDYVRSQGYRLVSLDECLGF